MSMLDGEWAKAVGAEFKKPYYRDLYNFVRDEYATHVVYPPADDIFNAMHFTPLDKVKVLILGQDPYHNVNQAHGHLKKWADQGVLLLNTVLTVRAHRANSHQGHGWEKFTDAIIEAVNEQDRPIVYMLWGRPAQSKIPMLTNPKHLILTAPHPSPLSAYRGFFGCKHFSKANEFLKEHGVEPIDWQIEDI